MTFTIQQSTLNKALQTCSKAVGTFLPASECFRFKITDKLEITCCNNEFSISTSLPIQAEECDILICADKLKAWIGSLPDQPVKFVLGKSDVTITAGKANCTMPFEPGENMPSIKHESTGEFTLSYPDLAEAIYKTAYARRPDNGIGDIRCGLSIEFTDNVSFFATNGDRMSAIFIDKKIKSDNIIASYNFINALNSILLTGDAKISVSKNSLKISCDGYIITGSIMDGKYFDWKQAIPKYEQYIEMDKNELLSAIKRLLILSDKFTQKIVFDLSPLGVSILAMDINYQQSANEELTCQYSGEQIKIAFNGGYLLELISRIESETVFMFFESNKKPGVFKSVIDSEDFAAIGAMEI